MANFNTSNPDQLIYENSILTIEVLGGVRLEGLDRMRVTLKVSLNESEIARSRGFSITIVRNIRATLCFLTYSDRHYKQ